MKNTLITEINRINELMIGKSLITEQAVEKFLKDFLTKVGDDGFKKFFKKGITKSEKDILLNKLKMGGALSDTDLQLILNKISPNTFAKFIIEKNLLGKSFNNRLSTYAQNLVSDPTKYDAVINSFNRGIDRNVLLQDAPDFIKKALKNEIKIKLDNKISSIKNTPLPSSTQSVTSTQSIYNKATGKELSTIEKILASDKTIFDAIRPRILGLYKEFINRKKQTIEIYEDIYGKIKPIMDKSESGKGLTANLDEFNNVFRDINVSLKSLAGKKGLNWENVYDNIEKDLIDAGVDYEKVQTIRKFLEKNRPGVSDTWIKTVLKDTEVGNIWQNFTNKEMTWARKVLYSLERLLVWVMTGYPKTFRRLFHVSGCETMRATRCIFIWWGYFNIATKIVLPQIIALASATIQMIFSVFLPHKDTDWGKEYISKLYETYNSMWNDLPKLLGDNDVIKFLNIIVNPFHVQAINLFKTGNAYMKNEEIPLLEQTKLKLKNELMSNLKKRKISQETIDKIFKEIENAQSQEEIEGIINNNMKQQTGTQPTTTPPTGTQPTPPQQTDTKNVEDYL